MGDGQVVEDLERVANLRRGRPYGGKREYMRGARIGQNRVASTFQRAAGEREAETVVNAVIGIESRAAGKTDGRRERVGLHAVGDNAGTRAAKHIQPRVFVGVEKLAGVQYIKGVTGGRSTGPCGGEGKCARSSRVAADGAGLAGVDAAREGHGQAGVGAV